MENLPSNSSLLLFELAVEQLFGELHALEIQKLRVLFRTAIERHADLPWLRKDRWIFDGRFVIEVVRIHARKPLDYMQLVAGKIPGAVEPGQPVQTGHVDH